MCGLFSVPFGILPKVGGLKSTYETRHDVGSFAQETHPIQGDGFLLVVSGDFKAHLMEFFSKHRQASDFWQDLYDGKMGFRLRPDLCCSGGATVRMKDFPPSLTHPRHPRTIVGYDGKRMCGWCGRKKLLEKHRSNYGEAKRLAAAAA
jgi:hypothetical protein